MHLYVVCYDSPDNKRRLKIANILEGFGDRVQYSVFECRLKVKDMRELIFKLEEVVEVKEDSVRIYRLTRTDEDFIKILGKGKVTIIEDFKVF